MNRQRALYDNASCLLHRPHINPDNLPGLNKINAGCDPGGLAS